MFENKFCKYHGNAPNEVALKDYTVKLKEQTQMVRFSAKRREKLLKSLAKQVDDNKDVMKSMDNVTKLEAELNATVPEIQNYVNQNLDSIVNGGYNLNFLNQQPQQPQQVPRPAHVVPPEDDIICEQNCYEPLIKNGPNHFVSSCAHDFHFTCLRLWVNVLIQRAATPTCPKCRKELIPEELVELLEEPARHPSETTIEEIGSADGDPQTNALVRRIGNLHVHPAMMNAINNAQDG